MQALLERLSERIKLMNRMAGTVGADFVEAVSLGRLSGDGLRSAALGCAACERADDCRAWLASAQAATFNAFTSFQVLGDSLSDTGNVHRLTLGQVPRSPPHWNGRFSNGPVWADHISGDFRALGRRVDNYAYGGAQASGIRNPVPDLRTQYRNLRIRWRHTSRLGDRPLVGIWGGANDLFGAIGATDDPRAAGRRAANAIGDVAASLARRGITDQVIFNLPDLGMIPRYRGTDLQEDATLATRAFNRRLRTRLAALRQGGANITSINIRAHFEAMLADPSLYGLEDVTTPCLQGGRLCPPEDAETRAFFDTMHPTAAVHRLIAELVRTEMEGRPFPAPASVANAAPAPVVAQTPLPAPVLMLLAGVVGLAFVGRRRRRAGA